MARRINWPIFKRFIQLQIARQNKNSLHFALSVGFGVFMSITPIWGFQILAAIPLAHLLKLNKALVFLGTCLTLFPPVIPFVLYVSYKAGGLVVYNAISIVSLDEICMEFVKTNFYQYLVGSLITALAAGTITTISVWMILKLRKKTFREFSKKKIGVN